MTFELLPSPLSALACQRSLWMPPNIPWPTLMTRLSRLQKISHSGWSSVFSYCYSEWWTDSLCGKNIQRIFQFPGTFGNVCLKYFSFDEINISITNIVLVLLDSTSTYNSRQIFTKLTFLESAWNSRKIPNPGKSELNISSCPQSGLRTIWRFYFLTIEQPEFI